MRLTPSPAAVGRGGRRRDDRPHGWFLARWVVAVGLSMTLAGLIEYAFASQQLEQRTLAESVKRYSADITGLEQALAGDLDPGARRAAIRHELNDISGTYGTIQLALFDAEGATVGGAGESDDPGQEENVDPEKLRSVVSSQRPLTGVEQEDGEAGQDGRYEFLLPVRSPRGVMVLEIDQDQRVIGELLADLRLRKALSLFIAVLLGVPLSYLLGGRALHRRQRQAERTADTDALTGLAGRRPFRPALEAALSDPAAGPVALALIDIDDFKQFNDRLGHSYGDRVLIAMAESCVALRPLDTAYRLGGDEFAVVLPEGNELEAAEVIERLRRSLALLAPGVTFSCGLAATGADEVTTVQELWERADAALYEAKRLGRRQTITFTGMLGPLTVSVDKLDAVSALLAEDSAITVAFQPIWDLRQGVVLGHEALLRLPRARRSTGRRRRSSSPSDSASPLSSTPAHAKRSCGPSATATGRGCCSSTSTPTRSGLLTWKRSPPRSRPPALSLPMFSLRSQSRPAWTTRSRYGYSSVPAPSGSALPWTTWGRAMPACGH